MIFHVTSCPIQGCMYNRRKRCMLSGMSVERIKKNLIINRNSDECAIKRQLNEYRMNKLMEGT